MISGYRDRITPVVLAGGKGTRLKSVSGATPKVLMEVRGRPFVFRILDQLAREGFTRVILATGFMAETVAAAMGDRYKNMKLIYSVENVPLGTGGALRLASDLAWGDTCLVANGDSYADTAFLPWFDWHFTGGSAASLLAGPVDDSDRFGLLEVDEGDRVTGFYEKRAAAGRCLANAGLALLARTVVNAIPREQEFSLEHTLFPQLAAQQKLFCYPQPVRFYDIGTPAAYRDAASWFEMIKIPPVAS